MKRKTLISGFIQIPLILLIVVVAAAAYYLGKANFSLSLPTQLPSSLPLPTESSDPTANWKTYSSPQFGYSFKYPSTWTYQGKSEGCGPVFFPPDTKQNWLTVCGLYINSTDTPNDLANRSAASATTISQESVIIDGRNGVRQELKRDNQEEINIFIGEVTGVGPNGKYTGTLGIYYYIKDLSKLNEAKMDLDQILSTFKFTK